LYLMIRRHRACSEVLMTGRLLLLVMALALLPQGLEARQSAPAAPPFRPAVVAGDLVYLSGMLPTDAGGKIVAGDIRVQTARVLDNLQALVERHGSRMAQVASVTVYLKHGADFAAMNEVYGKYWPKDPPTRTTVVANLVAPDALLEVSMVALKDGVERRVVLPPSWQRPASPYSYAIQSGNTLFLSGLVSRNGRDNAVIPGDMKAQTETVLKNAGEILAAAGMTLADVVSSRVFITDITLFQDMNASYRAAFPANPPARATVKTGLTAPSYLVEITLVAVKGPKEIFTTPNADGSPGKPNAILSSAVKTGSRLFLSGMLGASDATKGDAAAQTRETLARLGRTLKAAGLEWADVVDAIVYLPSLENFGAMNGAYREVLGRDLPARSTVEAGLASPDGLVEIMMTAVKR
jgi:2-iminobutanoate/2-iminopropanoate deaminase